MKEVWLVKRTDSSNIHSYRTTVVCVAENLELAEQAKETLEAHEESLAEVEYFVQRYRVIDQAVSICDLLVYHS